MDSDAAFLQPRFAVHGARRVSPRPPRRQNVPGCAERRTVARGSVGPQGYLKTDDDGAARHSIYKGR